MKKNIAVAISGGIDSLYTASLLKHQGHDVTGIHFLTGYSFFSAPPSHSSGNVIVHSTADENTLSAMSCLSSQLEIPIHIIDISKNFEDKVVDDFIDGYRRGITPNPCLACNRSVKFGFVLDFALELGMDFLATGHYAQVKPDKNVSRLLKGVDTTKDQSYFLAFLNQKQLRHAMFPLGGLTKSEVLEKAAVTGLKPVSQKESQDICFIKGDYRDFLIKQKGFSFKKGDIRTTDGEKIGTHSGLQSYTIGQRRGINCPAPFPYYVISLDMDTGTLIVGPKEKLFSSMLHVKNISWTNKEPEFPFEAVTKIRYAHKGVKSTVKLSDNGLIEVFCHEPVLSVTPGQGAVFYDGDEVKGGGIIV